MPWDHFDVCTFGQVKACRKRLIQFLQSCFCVFLVVPYYLCVCHVLFLFCLCFWWGDVYQDKMLVLQFCVECLFPVQDCFFCVKSMSTVWCVCTYGMFVCKQICELASRFHMWK